MKSFYKYLIFFILGIILCIIFKKKLVEGYPDACSLTPNKETCIDKKNTIVHIASTAGNDKTLNNLIEHERGDSIIEIPNYRFSTNELFNTSYSGRYMDWNKNDRVGYKTIRGYAPFAFDYPSGSTGIGPGERRKIEDIVTPTEGRAEGVFHTDKHWTGISHSGASNFNWDATGGSTYGNCKPDFVNATTDTNEPYRKLKYTAALYRTLQDTGVVRYSACRGYDLAQMSKRKTGSNRNRVSDSNWDNIGWNTLLRKDYVDNYVCDRFSRTELVDNGLRAREHFNSNYTVSDIQGKRYGILCSDKCPDYQVVKSSDKNSINGDGGVWIRYERVDCSDGDLIGDALEKSQDYRPNDEDHNLYEDDLNNRQRANRFIDFGETKYEKPNCKRGLTFDVNAMPATPSGLIPHPKFSDGVDPFFGTTRITLKKLGNLNNPEITETYPVIPADPYSNDGLEQRNIKDTRSDLRSYVLNFADPVVNQANTEGAYLQFGGSQVNQVKAGLSTDDEKVEYCKDVCASIPHCNCFIYDKRNVDHPKCKFREDCGPQGKYDLLDLKPHLPNAETTTWESRYKRDPTSSIPARKDDYEVNSGEILTPITETSIHRNHKCPGALHAYEDNPVHTYVYYPNKQYNDAGRSTLRSQYRGLTCEFCKPGYSKIPESTYINPNILDQSNYNAMKRSCQPCPAGHISNGEGPCIKCPAGYYASRGTETTNTGRQIEKKEMCLPCPGEIRTDDELNQRYPNWDGTFDSCDGVEECGNGMYITENHPTLIKSLSGNSATWTQNNFYNNLFINTTTCSYCPAGQERDSENPSQCANCQNGFYRGNNQQNEGCAMCPPGEITIQNQTRCDVCGNSGEIPNNDRNACVSCSGNQFTQQNEDGSFRCQSCPDGSVPNNDHSGCIYCDSNHVNSDSHDHCNSGTEGQEMYDAGNCGAGWISSEDGTQCLNNKCLIPSEHIGYIVEDDPGSDNLIKTSFNPTIHCDAPFFKGVPNATVCNNPGEEFRLSGCLPEKAFSSDATCGNFTELPSTIDHRQRVEVYSNLDLNRRCANLNRELLINKKCYGEECNSTSYCCSSEVPEKVNNLANKIYFSDSDNTYRNLDQSRYDEINTTIQSLQESLQQNGNLSDDELDQITLKPEIMALFNSPESKYYDKNKFKENWIGGGGGQEEYSDKVWEKLINTINTNKETKLTNNDNLSNLTEKDIKLLLIKLDMPIKDSEGEFKYTMPPTRVLGSSETHLSPIDLFLHNNLRDDRGITDYQLEALL